MTKITLAQFEARRSEILEELSEMSEERLRSFALNDADAKIVEEVLDYKKAKAEEKQTEYKKLLKEAEVKINQIDTLIEKTRDKKQKVQEELNNFKKNEIIRKFLNKKAKSDTFEKQLDEWFSEKHNMEILINDCKIFSCNHIWVTASISKGYTSEEKHVDYHCLKCNADTRFNLPSSIKVTQKYLFAIRLNTKTKKIYGVSAKLLEILQNGIMTDINCNNSMTKSTDWFKLKLIYDSIIETYPEITDEQAVELLKKVIRKIRSKETSEEEYRQIIAKPNAYVKKIK